MNGGGCGEGAWKGEVEPEACMGGGTNCCDPAENGRDELESCCCCDGGNGMPVGA